MFCLNCSDNNRCYLLNSRACSLQYFTATQVNVGEGTPVFWIPQSTDAGCPKPNTTAHVYNILNLEYIEPYLGFIIGLTLRLLMSYIYGAPILDVSRSHTTTQHSR